MLEWVLDQISTKIELPAYIVPFLLVAVPAIFKIVSMFLGWRHRNKMEQLADGFSRHAREWAIGEVSYLAEAKRSGFIDPRSGRKNVRFGPKALPPDTSLVLGQRVRYLVDGSQGPHDASHVRLISSL